MKLLPESKIFSTQIFSQISRTGKLILKFTIFSLFLLFNYSSTFCQPISEKGYLPITNFTPKEYNGLPQNWAVLEDKRGIMYFCNSEGVLEYDGIFWRKIKLPGSPFVRSLAIDNNGRIYVGARNEFGYLESDSIGNLKYKSLINYLPEKNRNFGDVWKTYATPEGIYFQTYGTILRWDNDTIKIWTPESENIFHTSFFVNGQYFVRERNVGLKVMKDDSLILLNNGRKFDTIGIYGMVPFDKNEILAVTNKFGIYHLYNTDDPANTRIVRHFTVIDDLLFENEIYNVIKINESIYSFGTIGGGVIIFNHLTGKFEVLNKNSGLKDESVYYQFQDQKGHLWLALDNGITRIAIGSPITFFKDNAGLGATIKSTTRYLNTIYVATTLGIYYLPVSDFSRIPPTYDFNMQFDKPDFVQVSEITDDCWDLFSFKYNNEILLLAALDFSIAQIDQNNEVTKIIEGYPNDVYQSKIDPARVFIGMENGLVSIYRKDGKWTIEGKIKGINEPGYKIIEDPDGNLWVGTNNGSVYVMNITNFNLVKENPKVFRYDTTHGLPEGDIYVELVNDKPLFATSKGLYSFLPDQEHFVPDTTFGKEFADGSRYIHRVSQDPDKNIWLVTRFEKTTHELETGFLRPVTDEKYEWIKAPFLSFSKELIHAIYHDDNGITWLGGPEGLYRYDANVKKDYKQDYYTLIRKVFIGGDSAIFMGTNFDDNGKPSVSQLISLQSTLKYRNNSLIFEYSAPSNEEGTPMLFSYYLEGYDKKWSDWSPITMKEYTNLHEKTYKFHVKSKNLYEHEGKEAVYIFTILPPWHRTILAYIGYVLFFIGFVYTVVTVYTRGLRAIIRERTAEIREQKDEIEEKNRDIVDSIQYASRIQTALLPPGDYIEELFPERFILLLPRDIVSGDFYWMAKKNGKIITVTADCTGHGVPGAFMSMLGMAFLNEITSKADDIHANEILNQLRDQVVKSLRQTGETGESQDGMDLALYILDTEKMKLEFAGANNPLFLFRNKELEIIKPDKMPIGISMKIDLPFTNNVIDVKKGDRLYTFSDGYPDQFGGPDNRKFMIKKFKLLLGEILEKPMDEQKKILEDTLNEWMAETSQIDDVLVIGVKV